MGKHGNVKYGQPEVFSWLTPKVRAWVYGVLTCVVPLLIAYGILDETQAALWLALAGGVLGLGTAYIHTPIPGKDEGEGAAESEAEGGKEAG